LQTRESRLLPIPPRIAYFGKISFRRHQLARNPVARKAAKAIWRKAVVAERRKISVFKEINGYTVADWKLMQGFQ
jgi:hypothetical protein